MNSFLPSVHTEWKLLEFSVTNFWKKIRFVNFFREMNSFLPSTSIQCGNYGNSFSRIFGKNFVNVTVLLNKLLYRAKELVWRNVFWWEKMSRFPHCVPTTSNYFTLFPWNQFHPNLLLNSNLSVLFNWLYSISRFFSWNRNIFVFWKKSSFLFVWSFYK